MPDVAELSSPRRALAGLDFQRALLARGLCHVGGLSELLCALLWTWTEPGFQQALGDPVKEEVPGRIGHRGNAKAVHHARLPWGQFLACSRGGKKTWEQGRDE